MTTPLEGADMANVSRIVGLDVHASETHATVLKPDTGELERRRLRGRPHELIPWLQSLEQPLRAVDTLTAVGLCAEVCDFARFRPKQLVAYLGIVPSEHSSGERRRQGEITKAGSKHARRLLIEAAKHYRHNPHVSAKLRARQEGADPRAVEIAWRAQRRLHQRWRHLADTRGLQANKATVAVARELAAFCWEIAMLD